MARGTFARTVSQSHNLNILLLVSSSQSDVLSPASSVTENSVKGKCRDTRQDSSDLSLLMIVFVT